MKDYIEYTKMLPILFTCQQAFKEFGKKQLRCPVKNLVRRSLEKCSYSLKPGGWSGISRGGGDMQNQEKYKEGSKDNKQK